MGMRGFNIILAGAVLGLVVGCQTGSVSTKKKADKEASTLRLHVTVYPDGSGRSIMVPIYRAAPTMVNVEKTPVLNEGDLAQAAVTNILGGFSIYLQFNERGTRILEMTTVANRDQRLAIFSQFGDARWLAAPVITQRITNGVLLFTPDATRAEAERIVRGLNNVAAEMKKQEPF